MKFVNELIGYLEGEEVHFYLGSDVIISSSLACAFYKKHSNFDRCVTNYNRSHSFFKDGDVYEQFWGKTLSNAKTENIRHLNRRSERFPFLSATLDFLVVNDSGVEIHEVKSTNSKK